jgi:ribonuclease HII
MAPVYQIIMLVFCDMTTRYVVGIDEVGRGPIAGPVAVGVFVIAAPGEKQAKSNLRKLFRGVKESKQLSEAAREKWFTQIQETLSGANVGGVLVDFSVVFQSERIVDSKGISFAIKKSMNLALLRLKLVPEECIVLLDGGLKAPAQFSIQKTIIKGDVKEPVIALASICAKVLRDRYMRKLAKKHPQYGFDVHKGYGTKAHYMALKKHGMAPAHRRTFLKKLAKKGNIR